MGAAFFFYLFAALTVAGALGTVSQRNPVRCAISLIASLLGVAGLFLLQQAEFLFAVQIVLYAGGVMLLFLFAIMLVNLDKAVVERRSVRGWPVGGALAMLAAGLMVGLVWREPPHGEAVAVGGDNTQAIGTLLLQDHLLAFELSSILLLVALVAAVYLAQRRTP